MRVKKLSNCKKYYAFIVIFILIAGMFACYKVYSSRVIFWYIRGVDVKEIASIDVMYKGSPDGLFYASSTTSLIEAEAYGEVLKGLEKLQYTYYADENKHKTRSKLSDRGYSFQEILEITIYEKSGKELELCLRQNIEKNWSFMSLQAYSTSKGIRDRKLYKVNHNQGSQYIDRILELCSIKRKVEGR